MRARYAEDQLLAAIASGISQYVILGSGFDSFAYRRRDLAGAVEVFEVDHPLTQEHKRERLRHLRTQIPPNVTFVPLDFEAQQSILGVLRESGYRHNEPAFFSWLGVTWYLTDESINRTLRDVASAASDSGIVLDYMLPESLLDDEQRQIVRVAESIDHGHAIFIRPSACRRKPQVLQKMMIRYDPPVRVDFVRGDATDLTIPAHGDALRTAGEKFLTDAFHRFGSLSRGNRVVRIARFEPFPGGNSGHKVFLSVEYAHPETGLHTDLFVKFSRDFNDAFRDRRRHELEAECRFAALSRLPRFPIQVPTAYFADFHSQSGTGLLITQRIAFGSDGIEPLLSKCRDHEIADPLAYYRATVSTLARLAAAHKSGLLCPEVDVYFPFDPDRAAADDPIPYDERQIREAVTRYAEFATSYPQLVPSHLAAPQFIARLERDALRFQRHEATVKRFLHAEPDFIALCHYNANLDNAWFWRDPSGALRCGLLDWGRVRPMNVAYALWGCLCCAGLDIWNNHLGELLRLFAGELQAGGGPRLDPEQLRLHLDFYVATMGLATLIEAPTLVLSRLPEAARASGALDPVLRRDEIARSFLHVFTNFLNLWDTHDFGASLDRLLQRSQPR